MPIDLQEFRARAARKKEEATAKGVRQAEHAVRHLTQAAVAAGDLTGQPSWDLYLRYVTGAVEQIEKQLEETHKGLAAPGPVTAEQLYELRVMAVRLHERVATMKAMISLPSDLIKMGGEAKSLLDRMEQLDDLSAGPSEPAERPSGEGKPARRRQSRTPKRAKPEPAA